MTIAELVQDATGALSLTDAFKRALGLLENSSLSSSLTVRQALARLVVTDLPLLQRSFSRHSIAELATSQTLEAVATRLKPVALKEQLLAHADDEARHCRMFAALANGLAKSTGESSQENYDWILENDRRFVANYNGDVVEFVCDLFAGEVRTHSFISAYVDALTAAGTPVADKACRVLQQVLDDEKRHVGYTAAYLNQWMGDGLDLNRSLQRSFGNFDRNSWIEVAETAKYFYER